jgi:hypothetical protein
MTKGEILFNKIMDFLFWAGVIFFGTYILHGLITFLR